MVVLARECRICPCASFTSAPASFNQTACDVGRQRQFNQGIPIARPAGFKWRVRMVFALLPPPFCGHGNTTFSGRAAFTTLYRRVPLPAFTFVVSSFSG